MAKGKSHFFNGILMFLLMGIVNAFFEGVVVAKLPFVPFKFLRGFSHRGLLGDDFTGLPACAQVLVPVF